MPTDFASGIDRALLEKLSQAVDRFDAELKANQSPRIEAYLATYAGETPAVHPEPASQEILFAHLFAVEQEYRARRGERPTIAEYRKRFPHYLDVIAQSFPRKSVTTNCWNSEDSVRLAEFTVGGTRKPAPAMP